MARKTRRGFVAGAVGLTSLLAGCEALDSWDDDGTDPSDNGGGPSGGGSGDSENFEEGWIDEEVTISEDEWTYWEWEAEREWEVDIEFLVRDGPDVDVFVTTPEEFEHFEDGDRSQYYGDALDGASGETSLTLGEGEYVLVVDNSNRGFVEPPTDGVDNVAEVEVTVDVTY